MRFLLVLLVGLAIATPALAQFPPPGIYLCVDGQGMPVGTLTLSVGGDYDWTAENGEEGEGQISSAGNSLEAQTGLLKDKNVAGTFDVDEFGAATFALTSGDGNLSCGLPPPEPERPKPE